MPLIVSKTGVPSVKASKDQQKSAFLSRCIIAASKDGVGNLPASIRELADVATFVVEGGAMPAGWPDGLNIAEPMDRLAFVAETRTANASAALRTVRDAK
jgi:hypothetical protein